MITEDDIRKITDLRRRGYSMAKIAKELNISIATIFRHTRFIDDYESQDLICPHCGNQIIKGQEILDKLILKKINSMKPDSNSERLKREQENELSRLTALSLKSLTNY